MWHLRAGSGPWEQRTVKLIKEIHIVSESRRKKCKVENDIGEIGGGGSALSKQGCKAKGRSQEKRVSEQGEVVGQLE